MTPEAALTKLSFVLGLPGLDHDQRKAVLPCARTAADLTAYAPKSPRRDDGQQDTGAHARLPAS